MKVTPASGLPVACLFLALGTYGCGSSRADEIRQLESAPIGSELEIEASASDRPDWVVEVPEEDDGFKYFSGGEEGAMDYALGMRMAKAEATQDLAESMLATWQSLFQASDVADAGTIDRFGRNFQELAVKELGITGAETEERYYERMATRTGYGVEYHYNMFVLLRIPVEDWQAAQYRALQEMKRRVEGEDDPTAEEFIDEAIERLDGLWR